METGVGGDDETEETESGERETETGTEETEWGNRGGTKEVETGRR